MCLMLEFTSFFQMHIKSKRKEGISMSDPSDTGTRLGKGGVEPERRSGRKEDSGTTKILCQQMSLNRQYRDRLKAVYKRFNPYYNV